MKEDKATACPFSKQSVNNIIRWGGATWGSKRVFQTVLGGQPGWVGVLVVFTRVTGLAENVSWVAAMNDAFATDTRHVRYAGQGGAILAFGLEPR